MKTNQYNAFISYRHVSPDQEIAKKLHSQIENYNIPSSLKKSLGISKMGRVFRDQEELPLSSNLGEDIRKALRNSEWLICVCSPRYLESKWCLEEVDYFISLGKRDKILAILVEGEPVDSFPLSIRFEEVNGKMIEKEPLAADVRASSLKESLKKLNNEKHRILAPMLNVNYDDLKQRDRVRRNKIRAVVSASVILLLSTFLMYVVVKNKQISDERNAALIAESKWLAQSANQALENGDKNLSLLLSLEALPKDADKPDRPIVDAAVSALYNGLIYGANDQYSAVYDVKAEYEEYFGLYEYLAIKNGEEINFYNKVDGTINLDVDKKSLLEDDAFAKDCRKLAWDASESLTEEDLERLGISKYNKGCNIYRGENQLANLKNYQTIYLTADYNHNIYLHDEYLVRHHYSVNLKQYRDGGYFNYYENDGESLLYVDSTKDGDYITALYKPFIIVWDHATEEVNNILFYPDFDKSFFKEFNIAPLESILAFQTVSGNVYTYDIKNKKIICRMDNQSNPIDGFSFNADGTRILAYSTERKLIMLFNASNGEMLQNFKVDFPLVKAHYFYKDGYGNAVRDDYIIASGKNIIRVYMAGNSSSLDVITPLKDTMAIKKPNYSTISNSGKIVASYVIGHLTDRYIYISDTFTGEVLNTHKVNTYSHYFKALENNEIYFLATNLLEKDKDNEYAYATVFDGDSGEIKDTILFVPDFDNDGNPDEQKVKTKGFDVIYSKETDTILVSVEDIYDLLSYPTSLFILDGQSHKLLWNLSGKYSVHNLDFDLGNDDSIGMRAQFINNGKEILIVYHCNYKGDRPYKGAVEIRDSRTGECKAEYFLEITSGLNLEEDNCYFVDEDNGLLYVRSRIYSKKEADIYDLYSGELKEKIPTEEYLEIYNNRLLKDNYYFFGEHRIKAKDNIIYDIDSGETIMKFQKNVIIVSSSGNGEALEVVYEETSSVLKDTYYVIHYVDINTLIKSAKEMLSGRELTTEERKAYFLE